jgi:large subunit ribosomal protein L15
MLQLNKLASLVKKRKRVGRGGSRGGTSGKGHKGQKARSGGYVRISYEGGQMPLVRRLPKRGFSNTNFKKVFEIINLGILNDAFNDGETVSKETLVQKGIINAPKTFLLKVLGDGTLDKKLVVHADAFSQSALKAIGDRGGQANVIKEI